MAKMWYLKCCFCLQTGEALSLIWVKAEGVEALPRNNSICNLNKKYTELESGAAHCQCKHNRSQSLVQSLCSHHDFCAPQPHSNNHQALVNDADTSTLQHNHMHSRTSPPSSHESSFPVIKQHFMSDPQL